MQPYKEKQLLYILIRLTVTDLHLVRTVYLLVLYYSHINNNNNRLVTIIIIFPYIIVLPHENKALFSTR